MHNSVEITQENLYRYPGAKSFTSEQAHLFMGRALDIEQLYALIQARQVVVLYGKSGMGKSSLINAGIVPLLQDTIKPTIYFNIRLFNKEQGGLQEAITPVNNLISTLSQEIEEQDWMLPLKKEGLLWYWLKQWQWQNPKVPIMLFFDQFEELFTYTEEDVAEFGNELRSIIYQNTADLLDNLGTSIFTDEQLDFLYQKIDFRLVFIIRSDRMALLNKLTKYVPNIQKHFYELDALTESEARQAIVKPAQLEGEHFISPTFAYETPVIDAIINRVKNSHDGKIETATLQIILHYIEEQKVLKENRQTVTTEGLGDIKNIFEVTYQSILNSVILDANTVLDISQIIEELFIQNERRIPFAETHLIEKYKFSHDILEKLERSSFLRKERDYEGRYIYEIGHDTWIEPILGLKKKREENIAAQNRHENRIHTEKRKRIREKIPRVIEAIKNKGCVLVLGTELCKINDINKNRTPKDFYQSLEFQYEYFIDFIKQSDHFNKYKKILKNNNNRDLMPSLRDTFDINEYSVRFNKASKKASKLEIQLLHELLHEFLEWYFERSKNWTNTFNELVNLPFPLILSLIPDDSFAKVFKEKWGEESLSISHFSIHTNAIPIIEERPTFEKPLLYNLLGDLEYRDAVFSFDDWYDFFNLIFWDELPVKILNSVRHADVIVFLGVKPEKWNIQLLVNFLIKHSRGYTDLVFDDEEPAFFLQELYEACSKDNILRISERVQVISGLKGIKMLIVYHHKDAAIAQRLKTDLEQFGIIVIIDTDNPIGFQIPRFINESIAQSDFILQLISENFLTSAWVAQESIKAFTVAEITGKVVLPCDIDEVLNKSEFRTQAMHKFERQLGNLKTEIGERLDKGESFEDLQAQYQRILESKNNYDEIIAKLRDKVRGDLRGNNYEIGLKQIISSIKTYQAGNV